MAREATRRGRDDGTALTAGLRRGLLALIAAVTVISAIAVAAIGAFDRQVEIWSRIERIDELRERLVAEVQARPAADAGDPLDTFDVIGDEIASLRGIDHDPDFADTVGEAVAGARERLREAEDQRARILVHRTSIMAEIARMRGLLRRWAATLGREERAVSEAAAALERRQRALNGVQARLARAVLTAQRYQRQILAAERLAKTASSDIAVAWAEKLTVDDLPRPCAEGEGETSERICSPSIARVLDALAGVRNATPETLFDATRDALWSLEGYVRAGEIRYGRLSTELAVSIDAGRDRRAELAEARTRSEILTRIGRVLLDIETTVRDALDAGSEAGGDRPKPEATIGQLRLRAGGFLRRAPFVGDDGAEAEAVADAIETSWASMAVLLEARRRLLRDFDNRMEALDEAIADRAARVRSATALRADAFATVAVTVAAILVASAFAAVTLIRRRLVAPLSQVTGTILGLAEGALGRPVVLGERAFGFDRLGAALERLRLAMAERTALAERNAAQTRVIESNLEDLERTHREMRWLALHDPLTGLGNRRHADDDLAALTARAPETRRDFCLTHVDVDRFKEINDALGHDAGDYVLKTVARMLREEAGPDARCYRIGGDEFLVVHEAEGRADPIREMAERVAARIARPLEHDGRVCRVGASLGSAFGRDAGFDAAATLINADLALYAAKRDGRGVHRFFAAELQDVSRRRKAMSDLLLEAVETEAFVPHYQPQFHARDLSLRGVETLCRWRHAERGWIAPGDFLPLAGDLRLVARIDRILFAKVAADVARLRDMGLTPPKLSFNVTADRLLEATLAEELTRTIGPDVPIAVELLESMSLDDPTESLAWAVDALKERGVGIEIDDFGSCRASVAGLVAVGPDAMKIDRSIVAPVTTSPRHRQLVKAIVEIGHALDIEVLAEGVETEAHVDLLRRLGCDVLQGYALARPMPFEALVEVLRAGGGATSARPPQDAAAG